MAVRWIGLFTRHVRQARIAAQQTHLSGEYSPGPDAPAPSAASAAGEHHPPLERSRSRQSLADATQAIEAVGSFRNERSLTQNSNESIANFDRMHSAGSPLAPTAALHPLWNRIDRLVLRHRLDAAWPQFALVLLLCFPHMIFYLVRLGNTAAFPEYSDPKRVGCMFDETVRPGVVSQREGRSPLPTTRVPLVMTLQEDGMFILAPLLLLAVVIPVLFRLRRAQDALGLRSELLWQVRGGELRAQRMHPSSSTTCECIAAAAIPPLPPLALSAAHCVATVLCVLDCGRVFGF